MYNNIDYLKENISMQIVYHGSYCKVEEPKLLDNKYTKDFGKGFYCTILKHIKLPFVQMRL